MWTRYQVRWDFTGRLCGQTPDQESIIDAWLRSRQPRVKPPGGKSIEEITEEVASTLAEPAAEFSNLVFQRVNGYLTMRTSTVRAHLKDCASVLSSLWIGKIQGERSLAVRVRNGIYLDEAKGAFLAILRPDGTPIAEPDGVIERPIHVTGPRGERLNALKRFEYVEPARLDFTLLVLGNRPKQADVVSLSDLEHIMRYGGVHGYAGERSMGEGKYVATIDAAAED